MESFWHERWRDRKTAWDLMGPHPITRELLGMIRRVAGGEMGKRWFIPGCGRAHDAGEILAAGVDVVVAKDLVPEAIEEARLLYGALPGLQLICGDVLDVDRSDEGVYAGVFDRAMLCALRADHRPSYVNAMARRLNSNGIFASIPFAETSNPNDGPPFAITVPELMALFRPQFEVLYLEPRVSAACDRKILKEYVFIARKKPDL